MSVSSCSLSHISKFLFEKEHINFLCFLYYRVEIKSIDIPCVNAITHKNTLPQEETYSLQKRISILYLLFNLLKMLELRQIISVSLKHFPNHIFDFCKAQNSRSQWIKIAGLVNLLGIST